MCEDVAGASQQSGGNVFFVKYGGPPNGSPLLGGGIIILRVIRRHFLAAIVDPAVSLSTYSTVTTSFPGINFQKMALVLTSPRITVS